MALPLEIIEHVLLLAKSDDFRSYISTLLCFTSVSWSCKRLTYPLIYENIDIPLLFRSVCRVSLW